MTIEGHTDIAFTEDVAARFIAYGWNVTTVADANDLEAVARALHTFRAEHERPTLILVHSHIGYGSPVEDSPKAHGEPFGVEGVRDTKRFLGMPEDKDFFVPDGVYEHFAAGIGAHGDVARREWQDLLGRYRAELPGPGRRVRPHAAPRPARGMGGRSARRSRPTKGHRQPRLVGPGAQRAG